MSNSQRATIFGALFLLSAATLAWEIILSRVFAITQFYHFAFLAVNVALLGFGASGAVLSLRPQWMGANGIDHMHSQSRLYQRLGWITFAFALTLLGGYLFINMLPFDSYAIAWDRRQIWLLVAYYLALTLPFFCTGLAVGMVLVISRQHSNQAYASNLLGSAFGALAAPFILAWLGIPAVVFLITAVAIVAALILQLRSRSISGIVFVFVLGLLLFALFYPPRSANLHLSPYKGLPQALNYPASRVIAQSDSSVSRINLIESAGVRSLPGLSFQYRGPIPPQYGLLSDGDDLTAVIDTRSPTDWDFLDYLPEALAYQLAAEGRALVLDPGGGLAIWQALYGGESERSLVAIAPDPATLVHVDELLEQSSPFRQPQVSAVAESARSYLKRDESQYILIHLALTQPYRPVTSGAFSLSEDYTLTTEAVTSYFNHLDPGGYLLLSRWLQIPPSESVRTLALLVESLRQRGIEDPVQHIVILRGVQIATFLAKQTPWTAAELEQVRAFARSRRFDLALAPDLRQDEINQFNVLPEPYYERAYAAMLSTSDLSQFYDSQPFAVEPPTDNEPFFFHFFRWSQTPAVLQTLGQSWQPFGGSGILVLVALLFLSLLASVVLILVPLLVWQIIGKGSGDGGKRRVSLWRVLVYFGALGIGYLLVEIPFIQRFILFLGDPTLALAVVLAGLLFWSGIGSLIALRIPWRIALVALLLTLMAYQIGLGSAFDLLLAASFPGRLFAAFLLLAPLGLLMGMPFPWGLRWVGDESPQLTTWAWAINGCTAVIASVLAALLALQWGFDWVLLLGLGAYAVALFAVWNQVNITTIPLPDHHPPEAQSAPHPG